jgi:hypothetical protein
VFTTRLPDVPAGTVTATAGGASIETAYPAATCG